MRYRDAAHVDVLGFYARRPQLGKFYRLLGYAGIAAGVVACDPLRLTVLLAALVLGWLAAWYQIVGTLWRSSLVAAIALVAIKLSLLRCGAGL